jgi:hypothetical protein
MQHKPCKPDQERNPATNRCRKTCKSGTVRNNKGRCVKSVSRPPQTKLSDYYPVSRIRRTYKRKQPKKPSVQTQLDKYFIR